MNIGLIGVGKLGLAYALLFDKCGFSVWASSYKADYIQQLQARKLSATEPGITSLLAECKVNFTIDNHEIIQQCDFIYVMVATPSHDTGDYDTSAVESVAQDLLDHQGPVAGKILVVGSTVNPGTCEALQSRLRQRDVHVVYCPTFSAQGTVLRDIQNPHTLSIGTLDQNIGHKCREVFQQLIPKNTPVYIMHPRTAEIMKIAGNCRATMQISFFNMIGQMLLSQGLGEDLHTAMQYLNFIKHDNRWKFGFGYGGPCYPRDNRSMVYWAQGQGLEYALGQHIDQFNQQHADFLTDWLIKDNHQALPFYFGYVSYKPGVAIFEESHQLQVAKNLLSKGHTVYIEPTEFLIAQVKEDLTASFGQSVAFDSLDALASRRISIYNVTDRI